MSIACLAVTENPDIAEANLFVGLKKVGIDIDVICAGTTKHRPLLEAAGIRVIPFEFKSRFDKAGRQFFKGLLSQKTYQIVHAFNNRTVSNTLAVCKHFSSIKYIAYRGIEGNVSYFDPISWTTYLSPRVDVIVCVADAIRRFFHNMSVLGIPAPVKKAITIYKGHDASWYDYPTGDLTEFGLATNDFVVGCIVNDRPRKGLDQLVAALEYLPSDVKLKLLLIGDIKRQKLIDQISASPYSAHVVRTGFRKDAPSLIKACQVCILPAIKREGLPKGIIEGMIQGVAPVVTNSGGSPELIEEGKSGLIVPPKNPRAIAEALTKLYRDRDLLKAIQQEAPVRIMQDFHTSSTVDQHLSLYRKLVA